MSNDSRVVRKWVGLAFKESGQAFVLIVAGAVLMAANSLVLAAQAEVEILGGYIAVNSMIAYFSAFNSMGSGNSVVKIVSNFSLNDGAIYSYLKWLPRLLAPLLLFSIIVSLFFVQYFLDIPDVNIKTVLSVSFLVVLLPVLLIVSAISRAFRHTFYSLFPVHVCRHLVMAIFLGYSYACSKTLNVSDVLIFELLGVVFALTLSLLFLKYKVLVGSNKNQRDDDLIRHKTWMASGLMQGLTALSQQAVGLVDVMLVSVFYGAAAAGVYGVSSRISKLLVLGNKAVNEMAAPVISRLHALNDLGSLQKCMKRACQKSLLFSSFMSVVLVLAYYFMLPYLGTEYEIGAVILIVFVVGQFVNSATGPVGIGMNMMGLESYNLVVNVAASFSLIFGIFLVSQWNSDVIYAAVIYSVVISLMNMAKTYFIYRKSNIFVSPF